MKTRAQKIRLGIFIMISSGLLLLLVGYFTARRLFEKTDVYYVAYRDVSVSGLEVGSPVKYLGINMGSISDIFIDPADVNQIIIKLSLKAGTPIKVDATADIVAMGITGLKTIEIRGGSNEANFLTQERFIQQGTSLVEDISGRAEVIAYKVEEVLNNLLVFSHPDNLERISDAVDQVAMLSQTANTSFALMSEVLSENREEINHTVMVSSAIVDNLEYASLDLQQALYRVNYIMQGDTIGEVLGNLRDISQTLREANLTGLIEDLALTAAQTQSLLLKLDADLDKGSEDLSENLLLLKQTLENLNETSRRISNDPSVLLRGNRARDIPDRRLQ